MLWLVVCLGMFHVKRSWMVELFGVCCLLPVGCQGVGVSRGTSFLPIFMAGYGDG